MPQSVTIEPRHDSHRGAPAPNLAGQVLPQAVQCEIASLPSSGSVVPS